MKVFTPKLVLVLTNQHDIRPVEREIEQVVFINANNLFQKALISDNICFIS